MKVIKLLILVIIAANTVQTMQKHVATKITIPIGESKVEQDLVFKIGGEPIAQIPESLAKIISPVFKAQLEGPMAEGRYIIDIEDESPDTVRLFANIILAGYPQLKDLFVPRPVLLRKIIKYHTAQKNFTEQNLIENLNKNKDLIESYLQNNKHLIVELYAFLEKYEINVLMPFLAKLLVQEIAREENLYNAENFPVNHALAQTVCTQQKVFFREPLIISGKYASFSISPGGHYIAIINDKKVQIYDPHTKTNIGTIEHDGYVKKVKFNPDETFMVTASTDNTAKIYDLHKKEIIDIIKHEGTVNAVDIGKKFMVTASADNTAKIYDLHKKRVINTIKDDALASAFLNPDETLIAIISIYNMLKIYNVDKKKVMHTLIIDDGWWGIEDEPDFDWEASFSPDGNFLVATYNNAAKIWDVQKQEIIHTIKNRVTSIAFDPDNHYIAFISEGSEEEDVYLYNIQEDLAIKLKTNVVLSKVYFSPDGNFLVAEPENEDYILIYKKPFENPPKMPYFNSMALSSPDSRYSIGGIMRTNDLVQNQGYNRLTIFDRLSKKEIIIRTNNLPTRIKFSPDNSFFIMQEPDHEILLYPITTCDMPYEQIIAIATLIRMSETTELNQSYQEFMQLPEKERTAIAALIRMSETAKLNQSSWICQAFMQLPEKERTEFIKQYPHVGIIMANIITIEQEQEQKPKAISEDEQQEQDEMMMVDE